MSRLSAQNITQNFAIRGGALGRVVRTVHAVKNASVEVEAGKTLGLVGESGSGKTTLGRILVGLSKPQSGSVLIDGEDFYSLTRERRALVRPKVQMVFQDAQSSLDPRMTVESIIAEPIHANRLATGEAVFTRVLELLDQCGLGEHYLQRYPHELSGGQRQRVGIARALATEPELLVLDEPTSALDVSVQAQVLNLLKDLQDSLGLSYVFISHDLAVVRSMSDEVAVMYLGEIIEHGPADQIFSSPTEDYTKRLLGAVPRVDRAARVRQSHPIQEGAS